MATVISSIKYGDSLSDAESVEKKNDSTVEVAPLGKPFNDTRRFFWEKKIKSEDLNAIATQPSVYDNPVLAEKYQPRADWENIHRFDPSARWTWGEETKLVRKIDWKIMIWACIMFVGLEIDRANLGQAVSDNLLDDLKLTTNDYNLGNTVFFASFLSAELPSQLISKKLGPDRWIPAQLTLWSIVAACQFKLSGRTSFLACRALLGLLQGGFIPDIILYLSYFYKHHEMTLRLGFFWLSMTVADIIAALAAAGLLQMRGVLGHEGWRWLFLIEGLFTLVIGLISFILMPPSPTQTASRLRGKKGWFNEREEVIMVNRIIRDDPTKGSMHNRQAITPKLLFKSILDFDLWPIYLIGLTFLVPGMPPRQYLTLSLRQMGFNVFQTNLLTIPAQVLGIITMMALLWVAERSKQLLLWSVLPQIWSLPLLIWLRVAYDPIKSRWTTWGILTLLIGKPLSHAIQVGLASRNSNSVRGRTVSAAMYNIFVQIAQVIASNIYRADDAPLYRRGNSILLGLVAYNTVLYIAAKLYYVWRNKSRDKKWTALSDDEKLKYLEKEADGGSRRLDFRFAS
ncbi:hypothetical protein SAPIO_CDS9252 [Scedosporium apiospermum]|uniref:Major facilitator superfamily (MFS) profile domain-containing protein n=1 Tax=Pseudallescheria apiosperma TaxID=563466 RepID=A0A084FYN3_PSEDA|nr:uncharacterized protein SAPIO_CDS9252 [Scedosporium apiospermum]KEZ40195.1 hypothetical protein SAPIO_CDS9252 [Scedosporium apiospermum]